MAFSFNWAGVNIQPIQPKDTMEQARVDAANIGSALRGYEVRQANREYADIIEGRNKSLERMDEISNRIAQLQRRNEEIRAQLAGMQQTAVQPTVQQQVPTFVSTPGHETPTNYPYSNQFPSDSEILTRKFLAEGGDSSKFTRDEIKNIQSFVGVPENNVDGIWGPQSIRYWNTYWENQIRNGGRGL